MKDTSLGVCAHLLLEAWSGGSKSGKGKDDGGELHFDGWVWSERVRSLEELDL